MKSPDEFHYGIEESPKKPNAIVCALCGDIIEPDNNAVVIERYGNDPMHYHERCASKKMTLEDAAEHFGLFVSGCKGYELEEE